MHYFFLFRVIKNMRHFMCHILHLYAMEISAILCAIFWSYVPTNFQALYFVPLPTPSHLICFDLTTNGYISLVSNCRHDFKSCKNRLNLCLQMAMRKNKQQVGIQGKLTLFICRLAVFYKLN